MTTTYHDMFDWQPMPYGTRATLKDQVVEGRTYKGIKLLVTAYNEENNTYLCAYDDGKPMERHEQAVIEGEELIWQGQA